MNMVSRYECKYCLKLFEKEEECKKCEESHIMPKKMVSMAFNDFVKDGNPLFDRDHNTYPRLIVVQMADGKEVRYTIDPADRHKNDSMLFGSSFDNIFDRVFGKDKSKDGKKEPSWHL